MRVGISLTSFHAVRDAREAAGWMVARAAAAREAELDSLFVGDHHAMAAPYYQNTPIMGRLLSEWGDRPAGCLFLLPLWNPVLVAEQVGTLAAIAGGRFIMQCALGDGRAQFAAMGATLRNRPSMFEEGLGIVRRLLAGETVTSSGRYRVSEARIAPLPPEPVEVWIGGSAGASIDRAARLGDAWLAGPELTPAQAREWALYYRERCAFHGRMPTAIAIRRDVFAGESSAHARAVAEPILGAAYRGFDPSACVYGDVDEVAEAFREYAGMGYTDVIVRHLTNGQPEVLGSLRRLREVRRAVLDA
ncbi:MAG: LLM class flavin-dependent oxidoreductase [Dehalococcoidia bacterium]|nr:LLM class flavin-dependent oxidoreductase [Dehalococcoidia bacterium]NUQ55592.1 LLM class flavin-dependent oxidoreductase [Dehalococcoidia bacterium]